MDGSARANAIELVIFDHDGVLVDSEIIAMELVSRMLTEAGIPTTVDEAFDTYLGMSFDAVAEILHAKDPALDPADFERQFHDELFAGFRDRLEPIPGVRWLLESLDEAGMPIAIASSGSSARVDLGITSTDLVTFFPDHVRTTRDHVERGKPFPDLFLLAAERAGVDPAHCVVVEDSPHGIEAARRAGMRVIGLAHRTPAARLADADWVVTDARLIGPLILDA